MATMRTLAPSGRRLTATSRVGFDTLPDQYVNREQQRGFRFNIACIGETAIGKSALLDSLFDTDFEQKPHNHDEEPHVEHSCKVVSEGGVDLQLTITCSVGYGDQIDRTDTYKPLLDYVDAQFEEYLQEELKMNRQLHSYTDTRVHACLFLVSPTGTCLKSMDLVALKKLCDKVNVIVVIAKADTITKSELERFKQTLREEFAANGLQLFQPEVDTNQYPLAVVGSQEKVVIGGESVRVRQYPWGIVEVENDDHSDFLRLRNLLLRTHLEVLRLSTHTTFYERYRQRRLVDLGFAPSGRHTSTSGADGDAEDVPESLTEVYEQKRRQYKELMARKEQQLKEQFMQKVNEKEGEIRKIEKELRGKRDELVNIHRSEEAKIKAALQALARDRAAWQAECEARRKEEMSKDSKKKDKKDKHRHK
ncbi:septin [Salpingoeca rosetta]|uniref:Septin n=1 Tax=Salpingoeca rosetta (strain ATCC 50818 / BSB-021) TaxID=946362 RepID=F2UDE9_SALR5|nr:septin [Salpingoeca rosetta]EGD74644.1 septin [Salpingoeca rosetta]|eukprot:XP_004992901.1 septin [Salpingoeca rosetta]